MNYRCTFVHRGQPFVAEGARLTQFTAGFWVNGAYKFTEGSDAQFWIPPHKIEWIERASTQLPPGVTGRPT